MSETNVQKTTVRLIPFTLEAVRARIAAMDSAQKAQVSPDWLARLNAATSADPWVHGFEIMHELDGAVGMCGFKGPPGEDGVVEIAYGVDASHQSKGYATEAARALVRYAWESGMVRVVRAHTLPEPNASTRVLTKAGFIKLGEVIDPEDGLVWRWELASEAK
jgi:ribosomal-protein-alanine N-acetyltransferase